MSGRAARAARRGRFSGTSKGRMLREAGAYLPIHPSRWAEHTVSVHIFGLALISDGFCLHCGKPAAYPGARFCGAGCVACHEAGEAPIEQATRPGTHEGGTP